MKNLKCPKKLTTFPEWTCDAVAENLFDVRLEDNKPLDDHNISSRTYAHIYNVLVFQAQTDREKELKNMGYNSRDNWLENMGGNDYSENSSKSIGKYWDLLTDEMKEHIIYDWFPRYEEAVRKEDEEFYKKYPELKLN